LLELHGPPEGKLGPILYRLFLASPGKKRLLPISRALLAMLGETTRRASHVISPNGVDLERYRDLPSPSAARQSLGLADAPTVGYTGHLYTGRGTSILAELARRFPRVQFLWVGGRPEEVDSWRERLAAEGVANVTLTGFIENSLLPPYQSACDILLMPYERIIAGSSGGNSAAYCSPMKMFEYMACGRAIISSDLPVLHEVLDERNAVLCPPEDVDAWAAALENLLGSPGQRQALAHRAQADVHAYTWVERARRALDGFFG
jgi:glycosyltransferase involved in cell wall biosynthesis